MKTLLLLLCFPITIYGQNTIGLPDVINYSKHVYGGGLQNWDITQDRNGIIYIANNEGLLSFDGHYWNLYPLPNKTIVRSVLIGLDNRIYVGGQDELGYFSPSENGKLTYNSLTTFIAKPDRTFGDVWDIVVFDSTIFFRSANKIFRFKQDKISVYNPVSEWVYMGVCHGRLYAQDGTAGLMQFANGGWSVMEVKSELRSSDIVTGLIPLKNDSVLITTLKNGFYVIGETGISKIKSANDQHFSNERIYASIPVNDVWMAIATTSSGVYVTDHAGNTIQTFSKDEGVQNNNVLSVFLDSQGNLWLGLDNGIDFIAYNSAIKNITPSLQDGSGYSAIIHDNKLYTGTSNGLYSVLLQSANDLSFSKGKFELVKNTKGQTWALAEVNNQLLLGHHEGAFLVKNNLAEPISSRPGYWNFIPVSSTDSTLKVITGHYKGLTFFNYKGSRLIQGNDIPEFEESSRFVAIDQDNHIWVSHPYHGVFKLTSDNKGKYKIKIYTDKNGLPSTLNNHVYKLRNEVLVATENGVYQYNKQKDVFEPSAFYLKLLGKQSIRYLKEDTEGNIWFIHEKVLGVIDVSGNKPVKMYLPELNNKMLSGFEFIYAVNESNIFLAGEKGFYHINYKKYKSTIPELRVQLRAVKIRSNVDSILFGGYFNNVNELQAQATEKIPSINPNWKTIHFEYSSALFGIQSNLEYSYILRGFDDEWSEWNKRTEKEYTNLPPGTYTFEVKVRSNLGNESKSAMVTFELLPPWYQTLLAKIFYVLLGATIIFGIYKWQKRKFERQQAKYEEEQKRLVYIHELERNKTESELIALRNAKLEAEINFKNSELASQAMHLVKKGEIIMKSKTHLSHVMKKLDNPQAVTELKKMIKAFTEDDNIDKEWENFAKHFDKVHSSFLVHLKDKHPTLTPNELKLSAYLRMNLSTKEIAQLLNISVRGVEISRYRLRKKLQISTEVSLFDYFMRF